MPLAIGRYLCTVRKYFNSRRGRRPHRERLKPGVTAVRRSVGEEGGDVEGEHSKTRCQSAFERRLPFAEIAICADQITDHAARGAPRHRASRPASLPKRRYQQPPGRGASAGCTERRRRGPSRTVGVSQGVEALAHGVQRDARGMTSAAAGGPAARTRRRGRWEAVCAREGMPLSLWGSRRRHRTRGWRIGAAWARK